MVRCANKVKIQVWIMKRFLLLFLLIILPFVASAQNDREVQKSVKVYFRQGSVVIDENYMDNKSTLQRFADEVMTYYSDTTARFHQIHILSSVSPEGSVAINERIAKQRAEAITKWINHEIGVDVEYRVEAMGIDWALLLDLVKNSDKVIPYRDEVLELLLNGEEELTFGDIREDARFDNLVKLRNGVPYRWILHNIFPELRYAAAECEFWWEIIYAFNISEEPHRFAAAGGSAAVPYSKSVPTDVENPVVTSPVEWVTPIAVADGVSEIQFAVAPNPVAEPRATTLSVTYRDKTYSIPVEQEALKPTLAVEPTEKAFGPEGGNDKITFTKSVKDGVVPTVQCSESWVEAVAVTEDGASYSVAENPNREPRTATIVVEGYGQKHEVTISQEAATECKRPFYMSIKTNMLYDLLAVPNIGAEFYLGKNFSVAANWHYAWWKKDSATWYWRTYGGDLSLRYWIGKESRNKPLTGHHVGIYGQMITYDFEIAEKGVLADKWSWAVGVEYGYSLPIARRLNLDFTLGFGYHWGLYKEYLPVDGHYVWQATKRRRFIGPTKLEVSLVWLIGCGNYNKEKKGRK